MTSLVMCLLRLTDKLPSSELNKKAERSGANDFGICSDDDVVQDVQIAKLGISSDHLPVLFRFLSDSLQEAKMEFREVWNSRGDGELYRALLDMEIPKKEAELQLLLRKEPKNSEFDQMADALSMTLVDAGRVSFGKKRTIRAVQPWTKQEEVRKSFAALKEAEQALIDDMENVNKKEALENARTTFEKIRSEKAEIEWRRIRNKISSNESKKLLNVLLPQQTNNINLLDIQHKHSSPCSNKEEAVETMAAHYAEICSLPNHDSFNKSKKNEVEECINNIDRKLDVNHNESKQLSISAETVKQICKKLNRHSPVLLVEGSEYLFRIFSQSSSARLRSCLLSFGSYLSYFQRRQMQQNGSCFISTYQPHQRRCKAA